MTIAMHASRRRLAGILLGLIVAAIAFIGASVPASAHSQVDQTLPADGTVLTEAPTEIVIAFNEQVSMPADSMALLDANGTETPLPAPQVAADNAGSRATSSPLPEMTDGWYAVRWSAVSSDGHPVKGTFTFYVGDPSAATTAATVDTDQFVDPTENLRRLTPLLRGLAYLAGMLAVGSLVGAWALSSPRNPMPPKAIARARRLAAGAAVAGLVLAPLTLLNNAIILNGGSFDSLGSTIQLVLQSSTGASLLVRMSALFGVCTAVLLLVEKSTRKVAYGVGIAAGAAMAASYALAGHAAVVDGKVIASVAEVMHLGAAAMWLGAIPAIAFAAMSRTSVTLPMLTEAIDRFSRIATVSVILVIVGGTALSLQMFASPNELVTTQYGWFLLAKIILVGLIALVGAYNHFFLVPALRKRAREEAGEDAPTPAVADAEPADPDLEDDSTGIPLPSAETAAKHLRVTLAVEALALVLILAATAGMTSFGAPKAGGSHLEHEGLDAHSHSGGPGSLDLDLQLALADLDPTVVNAPLGTGEIEVSYLPGRSNAENRFTVRAYDKTGQPQDLLGVTLAFTEDDLGLGPIERTPEKQSDGSWVYSGRDLGVPGQWTLRVDVQLDEESIDFAELSIPIDGPRNATGTSAPEASPAPTGGTP